MEILKDKRPAPGVESALGIKLLDSQHQKLLKLCDLVLESVRDENEYSEARFRQLLNDIASLAGEHFYAEEEFMRKHRYASLERHADLHGAFEERLMAHLSVAACGLETDRDFADYLNGWFHAHLAEEDQHFKRSALPG